MVKGTTIQNFDKDMSRQIKLRKPEEFISIVMSKTHLQINKEWNTLSTKSSVPNGRINGDIILLRVMNK